MGALTVLLWQRRICGANGVGGLASSAPPIVGNVFGMIPKSTQASLQRNSLSVLSVTYGGT